MAAAVAHLQETQVRLAALPTTNWAEREESECEMPLMWVTLGRNTGLQEPQARNRIQTKMKYCKFGSFLKRAGLPSSLSRWAVCPGLPFPRGGPRQRHRLWCRQVPSASRLQAPQLGLAGWAYPAAGCCVQRWPAPPHLNVGGSPTPECTIVFGLGPVLSTPWSTYG